MKDDLLKAVFAYNKRRQAERVELSDLREMHKKLVGLLPPPGKILTAREFVELLRAIREVLK